MNIDSAINTLKRRKEEANKIDPTTTLPSLLTKLNNNLIGAIADVAGYFATRISKTEITNQPKVSVSNFPKQEKIDLSPVVKAIKEIPSAKETDVNPVVKAIKEIPQAKPTDVTPVVKAINNLPIPEPINFGPVVKAIKDIPKPIKPLEEVKVKNQITLDKLESLLSRLIKTVESSTTASEPKDDKVLIKELRSLFEDLAETVSDTKTESVRVTNAGEFPVTFPIASFRDVNGVIAQARLDANNNVKVAVQDSDALAEYKIADTDDADATKYYGFTDVDGNWYILRESASTYRYVAGTSGYSTNWTNRASLTYDYYQNVF